MVFFGLLFLRYLMRGELIAGGGLGASVITGVANWWLACQLGSSGSLPLLFHHPPPRVVPPLSPAVPTTPPNPHPQHLNTEDRQRPAQDFSYRPSYVNVYALPHPVFSHFHLSRPPPPPGHAEAQTIRCSDQPPRRRLNQTLTVKYVLSLLVRNYCLLMSPRVALSSVTNNELV